MTGANWTIRLSGPAQRDFRRILSDTMRNFGAHQTSVYRDLLLDAVAELQDGPDIQLGKTRDDIRPGLRFLHIARRGRNGRHYLVYRTTGANTIEVVLILHDAMDFTRHVPPERG